MTLQISKRGRKHKGRTTQISPTDRDLKRINWSCIQVSKGKDRAYAVHITTKGTAKLFGIGTGKMVYLHKVILARKLKGKRHFEAA